MDKVNVNIWLRNIALSSDGFAFALSECAY